MRHIYIIQNLKTKQKELPCSEDNFVHLYETLGHRSRQIHI
jgi:hypothetical protein